MRSHPFFHAAASAGFFANMPGFAAGKLLGRYFFYRRGATSTATSITLS